MKKIILIPLLEYLRVRCSAPMRKTQYFYTTLMIGPILT